MNINTASHSSHRVGLIITIAFPVAAVKISSTAPPPGENNSWCHGTYPTICQDSGVKTDDPSLCSNDTFWKSVDVSCNLKFDDMLKTLNWSEVDGKKQKTLPLRDLRLFWPRKTVKTSYGVLEKARDVGNPVILPRPKVQCYILDLGSLKLLCRSHQVDILYSD